MKRLAILGSTGSIGQSTLSIVEQFPERYSVASLAAGLVLGTLFLWLGVSWGGRIFDRRSPEILGASVRN